MEKCLAYARMPLKTRPVIMLAGWIILEGLHRLCAAILNGEDTIDIQVDARWYAHADEAEQQYWVRAANLSAKLNSVEVERNV
jgi:hypothetical protein